MPSNCSVADERRTGSPFDFARDLRSSTSVRPSTGHIVIVRPYVRPQSGQTLLAMEDQRGQRKPGSDESMILAQRGGVGKASRETTRDKRPTFCEALLRSPREEGGE